MRVIILPDGAAVSRRAADFVDQLVRKRPDCVLGLATGGTPLGMYSELIRRHVEEGLDFSRVTTFNLDEYVDLPADHPQSYRYFMEQNLFSKIGLAPGRTHLPDGMSHDFERSAAAYEEAIRAAGGIDLQVLGVGADGHIAFNEPGSSLGSRTRVKSLTDETIRDNARFFGSAEAVPRLAITMGVGTILESRRCVLLAVGGHKAEAVAAMVEGPVTAQVTATALQLHRDVVVVLDESAAAALRRRCYYDRVEAAQCALECRRSAPR